MLLAVGLFERMELFSDAPRRTLTYASVVLSPLAPSPDRRALSMNQFFDLLHPILEAGHFYFNCLLEKGSSVISRKDFMFTRCKCVTLMFQTKTSKL